MYKEVKVGDITVPMLANGATPIRYKLLFHKDILVEFKSIEGDESKIVTIGELAYVMAMQAKAHNGEYDIAKLNEEDYLTWLEQFNPLDIEMASDKIIDVYVGNTATSSEPKKKGREKQSER